jgi:alpha-galactosidase
MNENLHVQGYLQYWDDLLARNPGLWIDSCSSGGRRNDMETMRRSVPLHYTDFGYGDHPVKLAFHRTMYEWIPYFKECTLSWDIVPNERMDPRVDSFSFHCGFAPMLFATFDIRRDDHDYATARKMIEVWRKASRLILHGDYYPHTPFHHSPEKWVARQFDFPETGRGLIQAIRLPKAPEESLTIRPKSLRSDATYLLENPETGEIKTLSGETLARDGFTIPLPPRSGAVWLYKKAGK